MRRATLALLLLAGCETATPVAQRAVRPPASRPPAAAPTPPAPPAAPVEGAWSFSSTSTACTARVTHPDAALTITAGPGPEVAFSLRGARSGRMAFSGPDGAWSLRATAAGDAARASLPITAGEGRVRQLLGGGTLSVPASRQPPLRFSEAGVSGREWFGCLSRLPRA